MNWIAPSDLIEDQEALDLQNCRVDEFGGIRSRPGHSALAAGIGVVTALIKAQAIRYASAGTSLFRNLTSAIASGFDGNPLGMISWRKFLLITNKNNAAGFNCPIKDDGVNVTRMVPAGPTAAPVVTKQAEKVTVVSTMDNSETWTESAGTKSFDAADKKAGTHSLKLVVTDPGIYTLTRSTTPNLNSVGAQTGSDDDKHRCYFKVDDFSQIGDIYLKVDVSAAGDMSEYYAARIPRKKFKKASGNWIQFELRRASTAQDVLIADPGSTQLLQSVSAQPFITREEVNFGDLGASARALISSEALTFERVGNDDTRDWSTVTRIQVQIEALGPNTIRVDEWEVFGSAVGALEGKLVHYYTYLTADGSESNPSPGSTRQKFNRISAGVALIASTDPQVTGINVYRGGGSLGLTYRVNGATPIANATATYADVNSDETIFTDGVILEDDHDDPPAAAIFVGPYFGRIIAASSTANSNRYWWSAVNRLYFPGSGDVAGNWNDVGPANEAIVAITMHDGYLLIYKSNSIWRVVGDPDDSGGQYEFTGIKHGVVGPKAVITGEAGDYFVDFEGAYLFAGRSVQKLSLKIEPIFRGQTVTLASGVTIPPISSSARSKIALELINGRLYMSYPESGQSNNNVTLVLYLASGEWKRDSRGFSALYNEGSNVLLGGTAAGAVVQLESGVSDAGAVIAIAYQSKYFDDGAPRAQKTHNDLEIEYNSPAILTVTAYFDNGATSLALGTLAATAGLTTAILQFNEEEGQKAFNCSIRITGSSAAGEIFVKTVTLHFYVEARKGSSFDSDETDLGGPGVNLIRQVELDLDCSAASELKVLTDLPGNAMAVRETIAIPSTAGRRKIPKMLSTQRQGYLSRYTMDDTSALLQLYGIRVEHKRIGTYVIANEAYDSDEISGADPRESRALRIELENSAAVTVTIFSDLPGQALALRDTIVIPIGASRRIVEIPFTDGAFIRGRNFRIKMSSTADWILYGASLELRNIGTYIFGSSGKLYDSGEIDLGTERIKWLREIELDLETSAALTLTCFSDVPEGVLTSHVVKTVPATVGVRKTAKLRIPATFQGRLLRFKATTASTDFILYAGRMYVKFVGNPGASSWSWMPLPLLPTQEGVWSWLSLPVIPTGSNQWQWTSLPVDRVA